MAGRTARSGCDPRSTRCRRLAGCRSCEGEGLHRSDSTTLAAISTTTSNGRSQRAGASSRTRIVVMTVDRDVDSAGTSPNSSPAARVAIERDHEHGGIDRDRGGAGQCGQSHERRNRQIGKRETAEAAERRQDTTLGDQLPHDSRATGAQCRSHRDLSPPGQRPRDQESGDVGAGDEEDARGRARENQQRARGWPDGVLEQRRDFDAPILIGCRPRRLRRPRPQSS